MIKEPKGWQGALATPIERDAPLLSPVPASPEDVNHDLREGMKVEFERLAKLDALAAHYDIPTDGVPQVVWTMALASRLAVELGVPGFQERWTGTRAQVMREEPTLRQTFAKELGLPIGPSGHVSGAPPARLTSTWAALYARHLRQSHPEATQEDIALLVLLQAEEISSLSLKRARSTEAVERVIRRIKTEKRAEIKTTMNKISKGNRLLGWK